MSKKTQHLLTLGITLTVALLMIGFYFSEVRRSQELFKENNPSSSFNPIPSIRLVNRERADVAEISFYYEGNRTYLTAYPDKWEYSDSRGYILSQRRMRDKAHASWWLFAQWIAHENREELELSQFGLDPPLLIAEAVYHDGSRHIFKLGSATANRLRYFFILDDDPAVYLICESVAQKLMLGVGDMLEMSLPPISAHDAIYIRIAERDAMPLVLGLREGNDTPTLEGMQEVGGEQLIMHEPLAGISLSHSRLIEYVIHPMSQLQLLELAELHPEDLAPFGLENPAIEFVFNDIHFIFGDTFTRDGEEFIYIKLADRPHVFITEAHHVQSLKGLQALDITERSLALVPIADVEHVTIETTENIFMLTMNHTRETYEISPTINGIPVDSESFRRIFIQIISLRADAVIEPRIPIEPPEIIITHHRIQNPDTKILLYNHNANFLAVSIDGNEIIFATNRRDVERLITTLKELIL